MVSRASNAALMVDSSAERDIGFLGLSKKRLCRDLVRESQGVVLVITRESGRSSKPRPSLWTEIAAITGYPAYAGYDGDEEITCRVASLVSCQTLQKPRQVVGDVVDIRIVAAFQLPSLAYHLLAAVRYHQYRRHAELMGNDEVAREIFEHRRLRGIDPEIPEEFSIGLSCRLWFE